MEGDMDYPIAEQHDVEKRAHDLQYWYRFLRGKGYKVEWTGAHGNRHLAIEGRGDVREHHLYFCDSPVDQLLDVLDGKRPAIIMKGVTRICGYFSAVPNWNPGKRGELKDRQNGNYKVEGNAGNIDAGGE